MRGPPLIPSKTLSSESDITKFNLSMTPLDSNVEVRVAVLIEPKVGNKKFEKPPPSPSPAIFDRAEEITFPFTYTNKPEVGTPLVFA